MGARRIRRDQRQVDQAKSRLINGDRKVKERERREKRLKALLKSGKPPYTPTVRSWLSAALGKPATQITQEDVDAILKS
jgi:hypothetical protein